MRKRNLRRTASIAVASSKLQTLLQRRAEQAKTPATDEQVAMIWPPWNALPPDMLPEEKVQVLTLNESSGYDRKSYQYRAFAKLAKQFPHLPLDRIKYRQAFSAVATWSKLVGFYQTSRKLYPDLITKQWAFAEADAQAAARVAICRAVQELDLTHPHLVQNDSPTLSEIETLQALYDGYLAARTEALAVLSNLILKVPGLRTGMTLRLKHQAMGILNPPPDVPRDLYIARLDALGVCSEQRMWDFMRHTFPSLPKYRQQVFERIRRKPRFGKEPYAAFHIWVLDNRPIFENPTFGWQWNDIMNAAEARRIQCPKTGLKQWGNRSRVRLKIKIGPSSINDSEIERSAPLLSPAPVFGTAIS